MGNFFETGLGQALVQGAVGAVVGGISQGTLGTRGIGGILQTVAGGAVQGVIAAGSVPQTSVPIVRTGSPGMIPQGGGVGNAGIATPVSFTPTGPAVLPFDPGEIFSSIPGLGPTTPLGGILAGFFPTASRNGTMAPSGIPSPPGRPGIIGTNGAKVIGRVISTSGDFTKKVLYWPDTTGCKKHGPVWGAGIFNAMNELVGKDPSWRPTRRMNFLNPSALKRCMGRLGGFQRVVKDSVAMIECMCPTKTRAPSRRRKCPPRKRKCA